MKTFKLFLLIIVLMTTSWLMAEGVKVNILNQPTAVSQTKIDKPAPSATAANAANATHLR